MLDNLRTLPLPLWLIAVLAILATAILIVWLRAHFQVEEVAFFKFVKLKRKQYTLDPVTDMRPVCPNCHAMLQKKSPPHTIDELRRIMAAARD